MSEKKRMKLMLDFKEKYIFRADYKTVCWLSVGLTLSAHVRSNRLLGTTSQKLPKGSWRWALSLAPGPGPKGNYWQHSHGHQQQWGPVSDSTKQLIMLEVTVPSEEHWGRPTRGSTPSTRCWWTCARGKAGEPDVSLWRWAAEVLQGIHSAKHPQFHYSDGEKESHEVCKRSHRESHQVGLDPGWICGIMVLGVWSTLAGLPGRGCMMLTDQKHPMTTSLMMCSCASTASHLVTLYY